MTGVNSPEAVFHQLRGTVYSLYRCLRCSAWFLNLCCTSLYCRCFRNKYPRTFYPVHYILGTCRVTMRDHIRGLHLSCKCHESENWASKPRSQVSGYTIPLVGKQRNYCNCKRYTSQCQHCRSL